MNNNGIATVDATGYDYSKTTSQTVAGLHKQIETAYNSGMPILMFGWNYNGSKLTPMYVYVMKSGTSYVIDGKIQVSSADAVTVL